MRDEGLLKLFFADALPPEEAVEIAARDARAPPRASPSSCARWSRGERRRATRFPLMVLQGGIEFTEWFADWCERMEARLLAAAPPREGAA